MNEVLFDGDFLLFDLFSFSWMNACKDLLIESSLEKIWETWFLVRASQNLSKFVWKCKLPIYQSGLKRLAFRYAYLSFAIFQSWEFVLTEQINTKILALKKKETFCSFIGRHNHWMYLQVLSSEQCWLIRSGILWVMRHLILIGMWNAPFLEEYTHQLKCTCWLIVPQVHSLCAWNFYTLEHVYLVFVAFVCFHWVVCCSLLVCPCWSLNCPDLNIYRIVLSTGVIVRAISFPLFLFCWISPGQHLLVPPFGCLLLAMQVAITHC